MNPLVSVIIPTYQRASILGDVIKSVIKQSYINLEIIVVDDHSTDSTPIIVAEIQKFDSRVKFIQHKENKGPAGARNSGVDASSGELIAFLDSDDRWYPEKIEKQVEILTKLPELGLVFTDCLLVNNGGKISLSTINNLFFKHLEFVPVQDFDNTYILRGPLQYSLYEKFFISISTVLMRRELFHLINGFNPDCFGTEDIDFFIRLASVSEFGFYFQEMVIKENRSDSISSRSEQRGLEILKYNKMCLVSPDYVNLHEHIPGKILDAYLGLISYCGMNWKPFKAVRYFIESLNIKFSCKLLGYTLLSFFGPFPFHAIRYWYKQKQSHLRKNTPQGQPEPIWIPEKFL